VGTTARTVMSSAWRGPRALKRLAVGSINRSATLFRLAESAAFLRFKAVIAEGAARGKLRLHLGCGSKILDGWVNVDMRLAPRILTAKLPGALARFPSRSTRFIYASHVVEHIDYPREALLFAKECHRILVDGGALRIVVPGIEKIIRAYVADDAEFFRIQASMHPPECTTKLEHLMYALQQGGAHKYGYDFETMSKLLGQAGFEKIVQSDFNASAFAELHIDYRTVTDQEGRYLSLYVDAIK
jgi:predicted SAM-dependent methyltransferase